MAEDLTRCHLCHAWHSPHADKENACLWWALESFGYSLRTYTKDSIADLINLHYELIAKTMPHRKGQQ